MKKLVIFFFCCLLVLSVTSLTFASEQYLYEYEPSLGSLFSSVSVPAGTYTVKYSIGNISGEIETVNVTYSYVDDMGYAVSTHQVSIMGYDYDISIIKVDKPINGYSGGAITFSNNGYDLTFHDGDYVLLTPNVAKNGGFATSIDVALSHLISWLGLVLASLVSGPLSPLLVTFCVAVAVVVVFLVVRYIKKYN